jgi:hypothetical protein
VPPVATSSPGPPSRKSSPGPPSSASTEHGIVTRASGKRVVTGPAVQTVVAGPAGEEVVTATAADRVVPAPTVDPIVVRTTHQNLVLLAPDDFFADGPRIFVRLARLFDDGQRAARRRSQRDRDRRRCGAGRRGSILDRKGRRLGPQQSQRQIVEARLAGEPGQQGRIDQRTCGQNGTRREVHPARRRVTARAVLDRALVRGGRHGETIGRRGPHRLDLARFDGRADQKETEEARGKCRAEAGIGRPCPVAAPLRRPSRRFDRTRQRRAGPSSHDDFLDHRSDPSVYRPFRPTVVARR